MKIVAVSGTYRKGGVTDSMLDAVLAGAQSVGAQTEKIILIDKHIEFCQNCRACCQQSGLERGKCINQDDMDSVLDVIEQADAVVFSSPMNWFSVTAVTKRFIERLVVYGYWPWGTGAPKMRLKKKTKKAIVITSSAMPAIMGRVLAGNPIRLLKAASSCFGAKVVKTLYFGMVASTRDWKLSEKQLAKCRDAGRKLADH
jgi:multimeric flavodoxin WrbA